MTRLPVRVLALAAVAALSAAVVGTVTPAGAQSSGAKCPLGALKKAKKPVEIVLWHSMTRANEETLQTLVSRFEQAQSDVKVKLVNQTSYRDTFDKYRAGLSSGDLPDLVQIQDIGTQQMIDTQTVLPATACIKADKYDTSDYIKRVLDYYTVGKTLWPMPFNVSGPILYYNKAAFRAAGLDPEKPPATLDEVKQYSQKLKDSGAVSQAGFGLKLDPWHLEQWSAKGGTLYVNNKNGRQKRATATVFDNKVGLEIFSWIDDMVKSGSAKTNDAEGASAVDNLLGIGNKQFGMTIDSSAALGTVDQLLKSGQYADIELGVAPMPGPVGKGGVLVGGAAMYIVNKSSPEKQAASWEFAKFLNEPENQATWAVGTGYVPIRKSAVDLPAVQQRWAEIPGFKVAYDQLTTGVNNAATSGPVIGDYQGVRDEILLQEQQMFSNGKKPAAALEDAQKETTRVIQDYNERLGI
jgi:sn-glycerol 3-phosphate transport system substrate-binding protein